MQMLTGQIVSLQVSLPQTLTTAGGRSWTSAIAKEPVPTPLTLGPENLDGDYQANRRYHGGPDKALCVYSAEHYPFWRDLMGKETPFPFGAFGENLTVTGLTEVVVCIGDVLAVGSGGVLVQVSQPRQPCANVSKRWNRPDLPRRMEQSGWTGFYTRVIATGSIAPGDTLTLQERPHSDWTIQRANRLMYAESPDAGAIGELRSLQALSAEWKRILRRKLAGS